MNCISSIKAIDTGIDCLHQCSGVLVTSYDKEEIQDRPLNLINKLIEKLNMDKDVVAEFKGLHFFLYETYQNQLQFRT